MQSSEPELSSSGAARKTGSLAGRSCVSTDNTPAWLRFPKLKPNIWAGERGVLSHPHALRSQDCSCFFPQPCSQPQHSQPGAAQLRGHQDHTPWLPGTAKGDEGTGFLLISSASVHSANHFSIHKQQHSASFHGEATTVFAQRGFCIQLRSTSHQAI